MGGWADGRRDSGPSGRDHEMAWSEETALQAQCNRPERCSRVSNILQSELTRSSCSFRCRPPDRTCARMRSSTPSPCAAKTAASAVGLPVGREVALKAEAHTETAAVGTALPCSSKGEVVASEGVGATATIDGSSSRAETTNSWQAPVVDYRHAAGTSG